jgi:hypothetical protein
MGTYTIVGSDGKTYDVDAPSLEEANRGLKDYRQKQISQEYQTSGDTAPEWAKPFIAMKDVGVTGLNTLTAGLADKGLQQLTGDPEELMKTQAIRDRMGWAAPALDASLFARYIPSAVPKAVKYMGGGPIAKTLTGTTVAAGEGGLYGGVDAATHDRDVGPGAMVGAGGSAAGYQIGGLLNKGYKWLRGIDDIPPNAGIKVMPKSPTKDQLAEISINQARAKAGLNDNPLAEQARLRATAEKLAETPRGTGVTPLYSPGQVAQLNKIAQGDPATNLSRKFGNYLDNKIIGATAGLGVGGATGAAAGPVAGLLSGMATAAGVSGLANLFKKVSAQGTEEQVQNLRRMMTRTRKYMGPISLEERNNIAKMARQGLLEQYNND